MDTIEAKLDTAFIQAIVDGVERIKEQTTNRFTLWHRQVGERNFDPDITDIVIGERSITVHTQEWIGCSQFEDHEFELPWSYIVTDDHEAMVNELVEKREQGRQAKRDQEAEKAARVAQEQQDLQVQKDLEELARLESLYRNQPVKEI